ncbi:MAG: hypothetical protein ACRYGF_15995 [Janthinobacterium lividum]
MRPLPTSRALLLLTLLGGGTSAQSTPAPAAQEQAPPPKGKVLFERHEPAPSDTSSEPASPAPATTPTNPDGGKAGVSSSNRRLRTTLRRRTPVEATEPAPAPEVPAESPVPAAESSSSSSSSSSSDETSDSGNTAIVLTPADTEAAAKVTDGERMAVSVAATDLDLHLNAHTGKAEVRAQLLVRNNAAEPLAGIPLRISGALRWESVRLAGAAEPLQQHRLHDDLDHTGVANELIVPLPHPLAQGETVSLDLYYSGNLVASTQRLLTLGAPAGRAALTDWDTVTDTFTGLRGMGSVLWYPTAGTPRFLRDGSAVTEAVEKSRAANAGSRFHLRLTLEYTGARPDAAFFCGERQPLTSLGPDPAVSGGIATAEWTRASLGLHTPSLFIAEGAPQEVADGLLRVVTDRADTAAAAGEAAARIRPMLAEWLGAAPQHPLDVLDLPIPGATGFADGSLLVAPLTTAPVAALAPSLVQPLASAWLPADIAAPWLRDGLPTFLQAVWVERTAGRATALAGLAASFRTLQTQAAPPESSSSSSSQPVQALATFGPSLATCTDPLCTRFKAAYVFEMLRGMLGDSALQQAISGWAVKAAQTPQGSSSIETASLEDLLQQVAGTRKLDWFFKSWVDQDQGLPELRIVTVAPRRVERASPINYLPQARKPVAGPIGAEPVAPTDPRDMSERDAAAFAAANGDASGPAPGSWLVAVEVQNTGSTEAEVPVTVRSGGLTNTLPLRVPGHGRATIRVPFEADPQEVLVNDGSVPETNESTHRRSIGSLPTAP